MARYSREAASRLDQLSEVVTDAYEALETLLEEQWKWQDAQRRLDERIRECQTAMARISTVAECALNALGHDNDLAEQWQARHARFMKSLDERRAR